VKVLEKVDTLLGRLNNLKMPEKPNKLNEDRKLFMKPKVLLKPLHQSLTEVGIFYNVNQIDFEDKISEKHGDYVPEKNITRDAFNSLKIGNSEENKDFSSKILSLKDLLRDKNLKITGLEKNLANMEKKNVEKKLSIQKRDRRIKELEENMKIKEEAFKRSRESKGIHSRESLEVKLLGLELDLSKKSDTISKLEEENKSLRKFKTLSRSLEKELARFKKDLNPQIHIKDNITGVDEKDTSKKSTNLFEDEIEIEEFSVAAVQESTDATDETIESISSFLAELASDTNDECVNLEENVAPSPSKSSTSEKSTFQRKDHSLTKRNTATNSVDSSSVRLSLDRVPVSSTPAVSVTTDRPQKKLKTINENLNDIDFCIAANDDDKDDTITTLSDDDEIKQTRDGEDILLETMFDDHPSFSVNEVITIQDESVKSFLRFKPFSSLCAKSDNIVVQVVETKKRARQAEKLREIPSKRQKLDEFLKRAKEL